jgi:muramoyltetrapeptide carboxypeptidase LdcA involved in peptidoglycan recycling
MQIPKKLKKGDHIRIIAPSRSMGLLSEDVKKDAIERLESLGFRLSFGKNVNEMDDFLSSSVESRIEDLHDAFADTTVDGILTVIGGYNSNQLLDHIDYELLKNNPKVFCGFSDITAIANAIASKSDFITYSGPHFSSWAIKHGFEHSIEYFEKCCMQEGEFVLHSSPSWSDDEWFLDQEKREFIDNEGPWVLQEGHAVGKTIGSHTRCLAALQGTQYWPDLTDSILFLEEDAETNIQVFDRLLQSFIQLPGFAGVKGIVIGRFQKESSVTREQLNNVVSSKKELAGLPVLANVDFGHTLPLTTLPIGGTIEIVANNKVSEIIVKIH